MINIVLYQPEIPPNTGNIIRLCANTGATLHLIHPLGFVWDDKRIQRAGLDYHELTQIHHYDDWPHFASQHNCRHIAFTTKATQVYTQVQYQQDDFLVFGPETRGLPEDLLSSLPENQRCKLPMRTGSRSLNLSNSVAIALYEAWRQLNFAGAAPL